MAASVIEMVLKLRDEASRRLGDVAKQADNVNVKAGKAVESLGKLSLGAIGAGGALATLAQEVADARNELTDMETRTGISAETLSGLRLAAEGAGLSLSDFNEALGPLAQKMANAARDGGASAEAFDRLGVAVTGADGQLRSADAVFRDVLKSLQGMEDPTRRAAAATDLFGESGGKLMQALGTADLAHFVEFSRVFGMETGPAAAEAAAKWQRSMAELKTLLGGMKAAITDPLADGLGQFNRGIVGSLTFVHGFVTEITDRISEQFQLMVTSIVGSASIAVRALGLVAQATVESDPQKVMEKLAAAGSMLSGLAQRHAQITSQGGRALAGAPGAALDRGMDEMRRTIDVFDALRVGMAGGGVAGGGGGAGGAGRGPAGTKSNPLSVSIAEVEAGPSRAVVLGGGGLTVDEEDRIARRDRQIGAVGGILDVGGAAMSGDFASLAGMAGGPWGAVAGQAVSLLQQLGEVGAAGIKQQIEDNARSIIEGIRELPKLIGDVLPELLGELIPELVVALIEAIPALIAAQYELWVKLMTEVPAMMAEAFTVALLDFWAKIKDAVEQMILKLVPGQQKGERQRGEGGGGLGKLALGIGRAAAALLTFGGSEIAIAGAKGVDRGLESRGKKGLPDWLPFFQDGGVMPRDGLAYLHKNERVIPAFGSASSAARRQMERSGMGGGGPVVNINAPIYGGPAGLRDLVRELNGVLGGGGLGERFKTE